MPAQVLINLDVDDLARAIAFYRDVFDLRIGRRFGLNGVEMLGANAPIYLLNKPAGSDGAGGDPRRYGRHWTPVHLDFVVDDLDQALARALAAGARQDGDVRRAVWGHLVTCADPFGHGFCLLQFQGRGYDEVADPA
jgi:lactoylglutathione lyase